jgi:hypothetical protein
VSEWPGVHRGLDAARPDMLRPTHGGRRRWPPSTPAAGYRAAAAGSCPVAARYSRRGTRITLDEARQALGGFELATLPNDYPSASEALNLGKPLAQVAPRSELRHHAQLRHVLLPVGIGRNPRQPGVVCDAIDRRPAYRPG